MAGSIPALGSIYLGVLALMVERPFCTRKVIGSNPVSSIYKEIFSKYTFQIYLKDKARGV